MKVALLQPEVPQSEDEDLLGIYPPVGLVWLAGNVKEEVQIVDLRVTSLEIDDWDVVGISCQTVSFTHCRRLADTIRDELPDAVIVTGGHHLPEELLDFSDYVVRGEGEITFQELLSHMRRGTPKAVLGVTSHKGSYPDRPPADLASLDPPDYDVISVEQYHPNEGAMVTSRGCPYRCVFCTSPFGTVWRGRTPAQVVSEAEILIEKGAHSLHIMDDLFTHNKERVLRICDGFKLLSVGWDLPNGTRVDAVDDEMLTAMAASGCHKILYGIESGVQTVLTKIRKDITLNQIKRVVSMTKKAGIEVEGLFMVGNPGDTPETVKETVEFAKKLDIKGHFSLATPYPGTDFYEWVKAHGTFLDVLYADFEQTPVFETPDFSAEERLEMLYWASAECK